jgi:PAS domain S-box-containing protein
MGAGTPSLLAFLDAPVLVGDPEGRAAYVNPAFESRFGVSAEGVTGRPLAALFDGWLREALLRAVAEVCERGTTARFELRHAGAAYAAVASPILAEDARVGVVIVLVETNAPDERVRPLARRVQRACEEVGGQLERLSERLRAAGGPGGALVDEALRGSERLRGAALELETALAGRPAPAGPPARFEPARLLAEVAARVRAELESAGGGLALRLPEELPLVRGEPARLTAALADLLRERGRRAGAALVLGARAVERQGRSYVVVSLVEGPAPPAPEPAGLRRAVEELGGALRSSVDPGRGRTLAFRLPSEARDAA